MRLHIGIISCLPLGQTQFLNQIYFFEDLNCFVNCRQTDRRMHFLYFAIDPLHSRMAAVCHEESDDCDSLRSSLVALFPEGFDYRGIICMHFADHNYYVINILK